MAETEAKIRIKLIGSPICTPEKHKVNCACAGIEEDESDCGALPDTPSFRGFVKKIPHLPGAG